MFIGPMRLPEIRKRIHKQRRRPMKYEVVQSPEVHEPMGRDYAGMPQNRTVGNLILSVSALVRTVFAWPSALT